MTVPAVDVYLFPSGEHPFERRYPDFRSITCRRCMVISRQPDERLHAIRLIDPLAFQGDVRAYPQTQQPFLEVGPATSIRTQEYVIFHPVEFEYRIIWSV